MKPEAVVIGLGLAAGVGVLLYARRAPGSDGSTSQGSGGASGAPFDPFTGYGGYAPVDPWTGQSLDPLTGQSLDPLTGFPTDPGMGAPPLIGLSPQAESTVIEDNRRANDGIVRDNRDSLRRVEDNARFSNAIQAAAVTASTVPFALHGIARHGPRLGRIVANVIPAFSAPGASITQFGALTGAGVAAGVTGGAALGLGAVKVLETTGALSAIERANPVRNVVNAVVPQPARAATETAIKTVAQPFSYIGAVATGVVGHGSVAGNLRQAYRGTLTQKGVSAGRRALRRLF